MEWTEEQRERIADCGNEIIVMCEKAIEKNNGKNRQAVWTAQGFMDGVKELVAMVLEDDTLKDAERL